MYSKVARASQKQPLTVTSSASSPSLPATPLPASVPEAAAAASYSVGTDHVGLQISNQLYDLEKVEPIDNKLNNNSTNVVNIYETVDEVPTTSQSSSNKPNNYQQNSGITNDANVYETVDDFPTTSQTASSPSSRPTPLPRSPPQTAAEASFNVEANSVYIHPINSDHYAPMTSQRSSPSSASSPSQLLVPSAPDEAAAAAASSSVDADNVYIHPSNSVDDVPCFYQLDPKTAK